MTNLLICLKTLLVFCELKYIQAEKINQSFMTVISLFKIEMVAAKGV